jgi:Putative lumazine-binding
MEARAAEIYHEYLHLVRTREGWKIANALWQLT